MSLELVYIKMDDENPMCICPQHLEIVICEQHWYYKDYYTLPKYPKAKDNRSQNHHKRRFKPLDEVLSEIKIEEIQECLTVKEPELI